jgi:drug/metabolite transporter (DMT)-like permease
VLRSFVRLLGSHPRLTALFGALSITFSGIFYSWAQVSPETGTFFRAFYGLPILVFAAFMEWRNVGRLSRRGTTLALIAGLLFGADLIFWHHAIDVVGAGLAIVLGNMQVVVVAIGAWLLFGERPSNRTLLALPIILLGVALIAGLVGADVAYGSDPPLGVLLGLLTALAYGGYLIIIRRVGVRLFAQPVAIGTASTAGIALVTGLLLGSIDLVPAWPSHLWLVLLGVTAQSLGYLFIAISLPRLPSVVTSIILLAQPVIAIFLSMILLGETPSAFQLTGVALVISGIALATIPMRNLRRRALPVTTP